MHIVLLGASGMLAQDLQKVLSPHHRITPLTHRDCDITQIDKLEKVIAEAKPELVINASGYNKVDLAEKETEAAFAVNETGVRNLCLILKKSALPLVHFSTDYVFNGENSGGYVETDLPDPLSVYGKSKAVGERAVQEILSRFYCIRTSWLYGHGGSNFVDAMIAVSHKNAGAPLKVVNDQEGCPTYTFDLAQAVLRLLNGFPYGMYHIVNEESTTWFGFAQEIFHQLGIPQTVLPITTEELARPAPRPKHSVLKNTKFPPLRNWHAALRDYLTDKTLLI